jgi:molecular chaperone GrpE (heat shock protein)
MEKNNQISSDAREALEETLIEHHPHFSDNLWREIFSQVLLPVLDDIRIQVDQANKKGNQERSKGLEITLHHLLGSMNSFLIQTQ